MTDETVTPAIEREIDCLFASHRFCGNEPCAGNHLIMERNDSQYALYAHLKPYTVTTSSGERGHGIAAGIRRVKGAKQLGARMGNWLTHDMLGSYWMSRQCDVLAITASTAPIEPEFPEQITS